MRNYIPNINTIGTLIDRLTVENVKLSYFIELSKNPFNSNRPTDLELKISNQEKIKNSVEEELCRTLEKVFIDKEYSPLYEERTFQ